ncbi:MAG: hypothetical protein KDL87_02715 [Verrucomicrobiae bacterium]|nr:hypothetical protein [Verrucomicrobiae bacterium]
MKVALVFAAFAAAWGMFPPLAPSQEAPAPPGMVTVNLKLGIADVESVKETLPDLLSKEGQFQVLDRIRIIRITDKPENIEAVRKIIEALSVPAPNVRIEVTAMRVGQSTFSGAQVSGRLPVPGGAVIVNPPPGQTPGVIRQPTVNSRPVPGPVIGGGGRIILPQGGIEVGGNVRQTGSDSMVKQSILVRSGGTGILEVVKEVPMIDYFTRFNVMSYLPLVIRGPNNQQVITLVPGGTFDVPEFRWERAGAELMVKPVAQGDVITVEVTPRISAIVIRNPQAFRGRTLNSHLTGADQYVEFTSLTTTVTIANGATLTIGSFDKADGEFNRTFWGYRQGSSASAGSITLKATIE